MKLIAKDIIRNKTVLVRVDYNVPLNAENQITDNSRIKKSLKTINFLLENNAKVILISHFGRVKVKEDLEKYSLKIVGKELSNLLNRRVAFIQETNMDNVQRMIKDINEDIILLENTRSYDLNSKMESNCSEELSLFYSKLADIYINDAFGASHRKHASTYGVKKYLPSYYGFLIKEELNQLEDLITIKKRPFTVFMGGAKVEDKLPVIKNLLKKCDYLCLGGGILNSFLKASEFDIKDSLATENEEIIKELKILLNTYSTKIILTEKLVWYDNRILDISMDDYENVLIESGLIFINGTPGLFEKKEYQEGTKKLLEISSNSKAKVIVGGGDSVYAVNYFGKEKDFDFISSGGGASLEYISQESLPALEE